MIHRDNITGLILAGGAGRRVGGQDKGLLPWHGKPLVSHVSERLAMQTGQLLISCNRNLEAYQKLGFPTLEDSRSGFQGPLAGIEAARDYVKTDYLAVVACDTPSLPEDLIMRLCVPFSDTTTAEPQITYAHDGQREQYLFSVIDTRCLKNLTEFLERGERAVHYWYKQNPHTVVDFSDRHNAFQNYNKLNPTKPKKPA